MYSTVKELKKDRPDLVRKFESMTREELLQQCYLEAMDAVNMQERVQLFMNECTISMSKTTYTIESLKKMISDKQEYDINFYCWTLLNGEMSNDEIAEELQQRAKQVEM